MPEKTPPERRILTELPAWVHALVVRDDSFRFEALSLLERARALLGEARTKPDGALASLHLAARSLLAGRGFKSFGSRPTLILLAALYPDDMPPARLKKYTDVLDIKLKGTEAVSAAEEFVDVAGRLLGEKP